MTHWWLASWRQGAQKARALRAPLHLEHLEARNVLTNSLVLVPSPAINGVELFATAAIAHNDIWAIGVNENVPGPVVEHFDGTQWSIVSTPSFNGGSLSGVAGVASNDVWAVGSVTTVVQVHKHSSTTTSTLIEHWNGTSWSVVPSPTPTNGGELFAATAVSSNDVWATGSALDAFGTPVAALVEHWNGTSWSIVSSPAFTSVTRAGTVSADASNDIWAEAGTELLHFNGTNWSLVNPNTGVTIAGVKALSPTNVWAAGQGRDSDFDSNFARIEHWDGTSWSIVPSPRVNPPEPLDTQSGLGGIAAISANDIWAVGEALNQTLTEHWDGTSWSVIASPNPGKFNVLVGATALSDGTVAAVGYQTDFAGHTFGLILQDSGSAPKTATPAAVSSAFLTMARPTGLALAAPLTGAESATAAQPGMIPAPLDATLVNQFFAAAGKAEQPLSLASHSSAAHAAATIWDLSLLPPDLWLFNRN